MRAQTLHPAVGEDCQELNCDSLQEVLGRSEAVLSGPATLSDLIGFSADSSPVVGKGPQLADMSKCMHYGAQEIAMSPLQEDC